MYLRILSSVSVGLLHFSSLDQWVGVSHLLTQSKASNSTCDTGDQPPRALGAATSSGCVCVQTRIHFIQQSETQAEKTQEPG